MSSGIRLLPLVGGMMVGMIAGARLQGGSGEASRIGARTLVAAGFAVMAVGMVLGSFTRVDTGGGYGVGWFAIAGAGLGLAMPAAMNGALGALTPERSGVGSAVISAVRQVGAVLGIAVLGTLLNSTYRGHLHVTGLPASAEQLLRSSPSAAEAVAARDRDLGDVLGVVHTAFVDGLDVMLAVCAGIAVVAVALAFAFLPRPAKGTAAGGTAPQDRPTPSTSPDPAER